MRGNLFLAPQSQDTRGREAQSAAEAEAAGDAAVSGQQLWQGATVGWPHV